MPLTGFGWQASKQTDKQNNVGSPPGVPDDDKELPRNPPLTGFKDPCRSTEPRRPNPCASCIPFSASERA